jgi:hypothetical protein
LKNLLRLVGIGLVTYTIGFVLWHEVAYGPATRANLLKLETESRSISAPARDVLVEQSSTHKSGQVLVDRTYKSGLSYPALRAHYDAQLLSHGWIFERDKPLRDWGRNLGGRVAVYRKGDDLVSIQYAGEDAQYGWTYAISFTWGLRM